ncbi:glycosyltransferase [Aestuariivivens insulae]|uniref:glycosyltransferase n=1 Tax=Aestuariivivens insulae TaxID=1621988 RepID=UPI001F569FFF|nr:glycosyltransferase [Aestuariivivens insulae]
MAKKILILPSWYPNIKVEHGSYFREQAQFLSQNGFDVKVLMLEVLHTKSYFYHRIKRWLKWKPFQLSQDFLLQTPDAYSYPVILQKSWSDTKKLNALDKAYVKASKKLFKKCNWFPEVIHVQGLYKYGVSSYLIAETYGIPLVVIAHSPFKLTNYAKVYQERIKRVFNMARKVAGVSHYHKACLLAVDSTKAIEVVWNLTDERKFAYKPALKARDTFVIATVLRLSSEKDPITFFDAMLRFVQSHKGMRPVEVHVVGLSSLEDLTIMKGIDKKFIYKYNELQKVLKFYAWLDRDKIEALHQKATVFVSTSKEESFGIALREAMLCGTLVISTKSGGPEDTIKEGTGILVEPCDVDAIAAKLLAIYNGDLVFEPMAIRESVIAQSGRQAFLNRMGEFYDV